MLGAFGALQPPAGATTALARLSMSLNDVGGIVRAAHIAFSSRTLASLELEVDMPGLLLTYSDNLKKHVTMFSTAISTQMNVSTLARFGYGLRNCLLQHCFPLRVMS